MKTLETWLQVAGLTHFGILIASALTPGALDWRGNLRTLHPFLRTLFWTYGAFIMLVIVCFGVLTLAFAGELASGRAFARGFAAFVALFWLIRLAVQLFVFDARPFLTCAFYRYGYHSLTAAFVFLATVYGWAALHT